MSTTFWVEDGPTQQVRDIDWDGEPAFEDDGVTPKFYEEPIHEINIADLNFVRMFAALGYVVPAGKVGKFEVEDLPDLRRRLIAALAGNMEYMTRPFERLRGDMEEQGTEGNVTTIGRGMTIVDCGTNLDQVRSRLERLLAVAVAASALNKPIIFA